MLVMCGVKEGDSLLLQGRANDIRSRVRRYLIDTYACRETSGCLGRGGIIV